MGDVARRAPEPGGRARPGRRLDDLDAIDVAILRRLQEQGRIPNVRIARELGISEPTVRKRIERMIGDGIIKVVAVLDPRKTGYATDVVIGMRVEPGRALEVGRALSARDEVVYLGYVTGRYDLIVEMLFRDDEALFGFLAGELSSLNGVISTETYHVLRTEKINYDWKLPAEFGSPAGDPGGRAPSRGGRGPGARRRPGRRPPTGSGRDARAAAPPRPARGST